MIPIRINFKFHWNLVTVVRLFSLKVLTAVKYILANVKKSFTKRIKRPLHTEALYSWSKRAQNY